MYVFDLFIKTHKIVLVSSLLIILQLDPLAMQKISAELVKKGPHTYQDFGRE